MSRRGLWIAPVFCSVLLAGCSWSLTSRTSSTAVAPPTPPPLDLRTTHAAVLLSACGLEQAVLARINATSGAEGLARNVRTAARLCRTQAAALRGEQARGFERAAAAVRRAALLYARGYTLSAAALDAADLARARQARRLLRRADAAERVALRLINRRRVQAGLSPVDTGKELFSNLPSH